MDFSENLMLQIIKNNAKTSNFFSSGLFKRQSVHVEYFFERKTK